MASRQLPQIYKASETKIPVGISSCLMGEPVRFNGSHKRSRFCTDVLADYFDFQTFCPEVAIGLGTPRPAIRLVADSASSDEVRALGSDDASLDVTQELTEVAHSIHARVSQLSGYILMQKSPSCGLFGVKRYLPNGHSEGTTSGIFAKEIRSQHPLLPIEEAGRLNDDAIRENFMVRVFSYHDWRNFRAQGVTAKGLIEFHSRYKYLVMAHHQMLYKTMGQLLADLKNQSLEKVADQYIELLMQALAKPASRACHTNTLKHLQGYLKRQISSSDKAELTESIDHYQSGILPLVVPLALLKHHLNQQPDVHSYARQQVYLNPHPYELGLRNRL